MILLPAAGGRAPADGVADDARQTPETTGQPPVDTPQVLYRRHCQSCHGQRGDGQGISARYLFPKPRNFRRGKFRLVSSENRIASRNDIAAVIKNGIPGTSMPAFAKLSQAERDAVRDQVVQLWRDGYREAIEKFLEEEGQDGNPATVDEFVRRKTTPDKPLAVPAWPPASAESIDRGKRVYQKQNCHACHGQDGRGHLGQDLTDDAGFPTRARDFVWDELKSGDDASKLYLRIRLGIPGTPMPSSHNLQPAEIQDLVRYCLSLGKTPKRKLTNHQRARLAIGVPLDAEKRPPAGK